MPKPVGRMPLLERLLANIIECPKCGQMGFRGWWDSSTDRPRKQKYECTLCHTKWELDDPDWDAIEKRKYPNGRGL